MTSDLCLHFAGTFFSFFLQVAAGYIACSLLSRALSRPRQRFAVWMAFLAASALYWIALAGWTIRTALHPGDAPPAAGVISGPASYLVPLAWSRSIFIASEICLAVYGVVVVLFAASFLWSRVRLRKVLRYGRPAPQALLPVFEGSCRDLGIRNCELMVLPGITSPSTVGWLRPRVLLPAVCEEIGPTQRFNDVLQHELAHVARRDYLWAGLCEIFCYVLFFHPAVWHARKLLLLERELACDSAVIESRPDERADYADSLAYFVRLRIIEENDGVGLDFASSPSSLGKRVRFILAGPRPLPWWNRASRATASVAVMGALAVTLPAITVVLAFARPVEPGSVFPATKSVALTQPNLRKPHVRSVVAEPAAGQTFSRIQARGFVPETSAYSLTAGSSGSESSGFGAFQRPWREMDSSVNRPNVSDVVRSAITIIRPGSDHDRDRVRNPRLTH
jgi:beta-lactamase regulating signal transducer with metallopeptidase domain